MSGPTVISGRLDRGEFNVEVDLSFMADQTTVLVGPNGAGKSTLLSLLAGTLALDEGRIEIAGRIVDSPTESIFVQSAQRKVGVVFQDHALFPHMTVLDNVAFGLMSQGQRRPTATAAARNALDALGLEALSDRRPAEVSGGQGQRIALARALVTNPALVLLDEPLSALDVETRAQVRRHLSAALDAFSGPSVIVTHDPADALILGDTIVVMEEGRIAQVGSPDEIRRRPATAYVAAFAGTNLLHAQATNGTLAIEGSDQTLQSAQSSVVGPVIVTIAPSAIALHHERPQGSPRNAWETNVEAIEPIGDVRRVLLGSPLGLTVDVTPEAVESMMLEPGSRVWASVKATEVRIEAL